MIEYRHTRSGEVVLVAPVETLAVGMRVSSGLVVTRIGKSFPRNGVQYAYGYLGAAEQVAAQPAKAPLPGQGAPAQPAAPEARWCSVCQGPHRKHARRGVAA